MVLFTAGLEDYAKPICDAIESRYPAVFHHRLYRQATVSAEVYPCIKARGCGGAWCSCLGLRLRALRSAFSPQLYQGLTVCPAPAPAPAPAPLQDMSRLGRELGRCVLVDDTPLAFFMQPDHGIPVLQVRQCAGGCSSVWCSPDLTACPTFRVIASFRVIAYACYETCREIWPSGLCLAPGFHG